uniref:Uncharacterized protein n=1 Tax=Vespula pensylvanica TaxID=30213 RepID=A0A834JD98_VESPE|nr:hypothetical protein H0235_018472 [Vespula pensylvanica]
MFEADGVDGGAICKRGFIHLQFAEKPEAPEAERHLGSWILDRFPNAETHGAAILAFGGLNSSGVEIAPLLCFLDSSVVVKSRVTVSPWVSTCSNLHAVGPGSRKSDISSKGRVHNRLLDANTGRIGRTLTPMSADTDVMFSGAIKSPTVKDSV